MTVAELRRWALASDWGPSKVAKLDRYLQRFNVVLVDLSLCQTWAELIDAADRRGRPIGVADAWVAATAFSLSVPLITNNVADYACVNGLTLLTADTT